MSKQFPECPLTNHANCKDFYNPKLCAMARKDEKCLKKIPKPRMKKKLMEGTHLKKNDRVARISLLLNLSSF